MLPQMPRKFGRSAKLQHLCEQIHRMAIELGPGGKLPTVVELSEEFRVSKATINSALRELEEQNIVTRKHGVGLFVSGEIDQRTVVLIFNSYFFQSVNHSPFWDILLDKAHSRAEAKSELFELHFAHPHGAISAPLQRGIVKEIEAGLVYGVIGVGLNIEAADWIEAQGMPFVSVFGPGKHAVLLDKVSEARLGIEVLCSQGCSRLGFWQPVATLRPFVMPTPDMDDAEIFRQLARQSGLTVDENFVQLNRDLVTNGNTLTALTNQEQGFRNVHTVFSAPRERWPDGIIITNDMMAYGALMAFQQLGIRVGQDVRIACHANKGARILNDYQVPLSLIEYDPDELIQTAFSLLESLMESHPTEQNVIHIKPILRSNGIEP